MKFNRLFPAQNNRILSENGAIVSTSTLEISGATKNINDISLDDRNISIDEKGNFKEEILLSPGYNTIMLDAHDRFGSKTEKILEVIYRKYDIM